MSAAASSSSSSSTLSALAAVAGLGVVLLLVNLQPSEPFLTRYLLTKPPAGPGVPLASLDTAVWPVDTWVSFATLLPIGWLAEWRRVGYAWVIVLGLAAREATRMLLLFGSGTLAMAAAQGTYAAATSATVVMFGYAFRLAAAESSLSSSSSSSDQEDLGASDTGVVASDDDDDDDGTATTGPAEPLLPRSAGASTNNRSSSSSSSSSRASLDPRLAGFAASLPLAMYHGGGVVGSLLGQALVSWAKVELRTLFFWSFGFTTSGVCVFATLQAVRRCRRRRHHHHHHHQERPTDQHAPARPKRAGLREWWMTFSARFGACAGDGVVRVWAVWWVCAASANTMFGNYFQELLAVRTPKGAVPLGAVEAALSALGALGALAPLIPGVPRRLAALGSVSSRAALAWVAAGSGALAVILVAAAYAPMPAWAVAAACVLAAGIYAPLLAVATAAISVRVADVLGRGKNDVGRNEDDGGEREAEEGEGELEPPFAGVLATLTFSALGVASLTQAAQSASRECSAQCVMASCGALHALAVALAALVTAMCCCCSNCAGGGRRDRAAGEEEQSRLISVNNAG